MTVIVIGAGIAGCTVARMLAEREQHVHIYEQSSGVGGVLKVVPSVSLATADHVVASWLIARVPMQVTTSGTMAPHCPTARMCDYLLAHKRISLMKHIRIVDVLSAKRYASRVVSTASPDALVGMRYGALQWHDGRAVRNAMSMSVYWQYAQLLASEGILWCGSLASFEVLSIPQIIRQCMGVTDTICKPTTMRPEVPLIHKDVFSREK